MKKKGVMLMEVVIGSLILATVFGSLLTSFVVARTYVARADKRLTAYNLARGVANELYGAVRADEWDVPGKPLYTQGYDLADADIGNFNYERHYNVEPVVGWDCRQVDVEITFPVD